MSQMYRPVVGIVDDEVDVSRIRAHWLREIADVWNMTTLNGARETMVMHQTDLIILDAHLADDEVGSEDVGNSVRFVKECLIVSPRTIIVACSTLDNDRLTAAGAHFAVPVGQEKELIFEILKVVSILKKPLTIVWPRTHKKPVDVV